LAIVKAFTIASKVIGAIVGTLGRANKSLGGFGARGVNNLGETSPNFVGPVLAAQGAANIGSTPLNQEVNSTSDINDINVNINAPEGTVDSVQTKSTGPTKFNLGMNARLATSGAF
jgi:hypothetical protein